MIGDVETIYTQALSINVSHPHQIEQIYGHESLEVRNTRQSFTW